MASNPEDRRDPLEHDILVARRNPHGKQYFKVKAERRTKNGAFTEFADYTGVAEQLPSSSGYRAIVGFACAETQALADEPNPAPRGPALAALPLHPDPTASASCTCYLINPENITYETSWTSEEWSDQEIQPSDNPILNDDGFELLVASPAGKVYLLSKTGTALLSDQIDLRVRTVDLVNEPELWSTLRNGTVAGSVRLVSMDGQPRVVPVVNVQSLMPSRLA